MWGHEPEEASAVTEAQAERRVEISFWFRRPGMQTYPSRWRNARRFGVGVGGDSDRVRGVAGKVDVAGACKLLLGTEAEERKCNLISSISCRLRSSM